ncbi:MAG: hypothetical protein K2P57_03385 [Burkholderiales bacterium]|nr:hypothetical protein [Burkholderiales bacterium]
MIYVVEFPEQGRAKAWFAFERQDFARKIYASDSMQEWEIFDVVTPRELLELVEDTADEARSTAIRSLAGQYGWDTPLYRADYLLGPGVFQTSAVSETDACVAALESRVKTCRIYWSDTQATAALENDPVFDDDYLAREALREQLVALEILEGPYG